MLSDTPARPLRSRSATQRPLPVRPTALVAVIYLAVWLLAPLSSELAPIFGGTTEESLADPADALQDPELLVDLFFENFAVTLIVVVAFLSVVRWWRPILVEAVPAARVFAIVPVGMTTVLLASAVIGIIVTPEASPSLLAMQALLMLTVSVIEEVGWRGVAVIGLRGSQVPEWAVWLLTSAGFALMHLLNVFAGAGIEDSIAQVVYTFLLGTACYLGRRCGGLWLAVAVHFANNFLQAAAQGSAESPLFDVVNTVAIVGQGLMALSLPATIVLLVREARKSRRLVRQTASGAAPLPDAPA